MNTKRTETRRLRVTEAWQQYPLDTRVIISIGGVFWDFERKVTDSRLTLDTAPTNTLQYCKDNYFGSHCSAVLFTEQLTEEAQAMVDSMPPFQRLAYELSACDRVTTDDRLSPERLTEILKESGDYERTITPGKVSFIQAATLLALTTDVRSLLTTQQVHQFNESVNALKTALNTMTNKNTDSAKITAAILQTKQEDF